MESLMHPYSAPTSLRAVMSSGAGAGAGSETRDSNSPPGSSEQTTSYILTYNEEQVTFEIHILGILLPGKFDT